MTWWRRLLAWATLAFATFSVRPAAAELAVVGLEYRAPASCPSRDAFVRELEARSERVRTGEAGAQGTLSVQVVVAGSTVQGTILFREASGRGTERAVSGEGCDDVVRALALIAVVLVDPEAQLGDAQGIEAAPAAADPVGSSSIADFEAAEASAAVSEAAPPDPPAPPAPPERPAAPRVGEKRTEPRRALVEPLHWRFGAGAGGAMHTGTAPDAMFGFALEASVERSRYRAFGLALGLTVQYGESSTLHTTGGDADFTWLAARVWACPVRWPSAGVASLAGCAAFEMGVLGASGFNTVDEEQPRTPWLAPALFGRAEVRPLDSLALTLDAGVAVPLVRTYFYFDPEIPAYQSGVGAFAVLGVRVLTK
ncbi:MAG TPA: hypothetical protein VGK73_28895 [Polyangiaceae bacterium]